MFTKFDEKVINFSTMICWWTEVRWEKDNLFWVYYVRVLEEVFFFIITSNMSVSCFEKGEVFGFVFYTFATLVASFFVFCGVFFPNGFSDSVIRRSYPQGSPNLARFLSKYILQRKCNIIFFIVFVFIGIQFPYKSNLAVNLISGKFIDFLVPVIIGFHSIFLYLVACDSIPPGEKEKRKALLKKPDMVSNPIPS